MEPAHPDVLIPMPDIELYDNANTIKHEESKSKEQMEKAKLLWWNHFSLEA